MAMLWYKSPMWICFYFKQVQPVVTHSSNFIEKKMSELRIKTILFTLQTRSCECRYANLKSTSDTVVLTWTEVSLPLPAASITTADSEFRSMHQLSSERGAYIVLTLNTQGEEICSHFMNIGCFCASVVCLKAVWGRYSRPAAEKKKKQQSDQVLITLQETATNDGITLKQGKLYKSWIRVFQQIQPCIVWTSETYFNK